MAIRAKMHSNQFEPLEDWQYLSLTQIAITHAHAHLDTHATMSNLAPRPIGMGLETRLYKCHYYTASIGCCGIVYIYNCYFTFVCSVSSSFKALAPL